MCFTTEEGDTGTTASDSGATQAGQEDQVKEQIRII
jgi:hypothetical protein